MAIEAYFAALQQQLPKVPLDWKNVRRAYTGRAYHNLDHLNEMLAHLQRHRRASPEATPQDAALFGMALVYHDLIYKPTRKDNEQRSAQAAANLLREGKLAPERIAYCERLILTTKTHLPSQPVDPDTALLIDLDLAVLARAPQDYDRYRTAIRREFWMLPGFVFRKGRTKALTTFLNRPHIYHTPYGSAHYEAAARENLWRELRSL